MAEYYGATVLTVGFLQDSVTHRPVGAHVDNLTESAASGIQWNSPGVLGTYTCEYCK